MPEHIATPAVEQESELICDEFSLALSGYDRLEEASRNWGYITGDVGVVDDEWRHDLAVTPFHEAGHAVASTLAEEEVFDVRHWWAPSPNRHTLGMCRTRYDTGSRSAEQQLNFMGTLRVLKSIVATYAGPVAQLRRDPRRVFSGLGGDADYWWAMALELERKRIYSAGYALEWSWREACRMFMDERVWAATHELAIRLAESKQHPARVLGGAVRTIVHKHLPDGWKWSDPPPRMRKKRKAAA